MNKEIYFRNDRIDVARGILIFYIVTVIHGMYWLDIFSGTLKSLFLFEMPAIFILVGYAFSLSIKNGLELVEFSNYFQLCIRRASRILIPYWIYSFACILIVLVNENQAYFGTITAASKTIFFWLNPLIHGKDVSFGVLDYHLWFISIYLVVSILLPLITKIKFPATIPPLCFLLLTILLILISEKIKIYNVYVGKLLQTLITYIAWTVYGYALGSGLQITKKQAFLLLIITSVVLLLIGTYSPDAMNMQGNKFPPNLIFFIFSIFWMFFFYLINTKISNQMISNMKNLKVLKPFIKHGYSIYLWQGVAYTIAIKVQDDIATPKIVTWLMAISMTVIFGVLMSPFEKFRFRDNR